jgi:transglutaminase-like putative cysteine protease
MKSTASTVRPLHASAELVLGGASTALDPGGVDWDLVTSCKYLLHQRFAYQYPRAIRDLRHQLMVIPPATFGDQLRSVYSLDISEPGKVITRLDSFANTVLDVHIPRVARAVEFEAWVAIERGGPTTSRLVPTAWLHDTRFLAATGRTAPDRAIEMAADALRAQGAHGFDLAGLANTWVHETMAYAKGVTDVHTSASAALALRSGVCQDYAHLMIAICRLLGMPTLYVSGHLVGEGATHAWVEVLLPATDGSDTVHGWAFDPTHGCRPDLRYLTVAVGRDYGDVAPTSGSYRAGHGGSLTGEKEVRVVEVTYQG